MELLQSDRALSSSSVVVAAKEQISSDLAGEIVILDLKSGKYYGLNTVGASIWNLLQKPTSIGDIRATLLEEYEVETDRFESDLLALLRQLADEGLVEFTNEENSKATSAAFS